MTVTSELFLKKKFWGSVNYSLNVINISCCEHIKIGVNIYLYECVSVHWPPECVVCLCVCVCLCECDIKSEY